MATAAAAPPTIAGVTSTSLPYLCSMGFLRSRKVKTGTRSPEIVSGEAGVAMAEGLVLC
ncbi:hypothetical protein LINGRAHAP2_LOCUS23261 [Linum grandiflorum]